MAGDLFHILADTLQHSRHDDWTEQLAKFITDTGQLIVLCVKTGKFLGMTSRKRFDTLILRTGRPFCQQKRRADIVLQQLQRTMEKLRAGNTFCADPLAFFQHTHAVGHRSPLPIQIL